VELIENILSPGTADVKRVKKGERGVGSGTLRWGLDKGLTADR